MEEFDLKSDYASAKFVPRISWQEYFVDILGGLVPGILFLIGNSFIIFPSIYALNASIRGGNTGDSFFVHLKNILNSTQNTPSTIWIVSFIVIFFLAYTIGHLFYRHDPNKPDRRSFRRLVRKYGLEDNIEGMKMELASDDDPTHCQFPYSYYDRYLEKRGFDYLIPLVVWKSNNKKGENDIRSKCWINLYKTRLMYYHQDKCGTIIRNEAHVRLASSTWYVSYFLIWFGLFGLAISISAVFLSIFYSNQFNEIIPAISWYAIPILIPFMVSAFSFYFYWTILDFLHYQRLREIFIVLDTYYVAYKQNPKLMKLPIKKFKK